MMQAQLASVCTRDLLGGGFGAEPKNRIWVARVHECAFLLNGPGQIAQSGPPGLVTGGPGPKQGPGPPKGNGINPGQLMVCHAANAP
jgi:hypothetical protein